MPGALLPVHRIQIFDNGVIAPGAKAYFYASGTSTPQLVYSNVALSAAHANPVVADAEGVLPVIFLQALAYRVLVTDAAGATIFPAQDDILDLADVVATVPTQNANLVYAGPASGSAATPTFRALVLADLPTLPSTTKPFLVWGALGNQPPSSAFATLDTRNGHPVLDFDGSTDEEAVFAGVLSPDYAAGGLTCDLWVSFTSATSGNVRFQAAIERIDVSSLDIDADSFAAFESVGGTAPATSGMVIKLSLPFTAGAQMDGLVAGEALRLKIRRDADGTSGTDDIATDAEVLRVVLRET